YCPPRRRRFPQTALRVRAQRASERPDRSGNLRCEARESWIRRPFSAFPTIPDWLPRHRGATQGGRTLGRRPRRVKGAEGVKFPNRSKGLRPVFRVYSWAALARSAFRVVRVSASVFRDSACFSGGSLLSGICRSASRASLAAIRTSGFT